MVTDAAPALRTVQGKIMRMFVRAKASLAASAVIAGMLASFATPAAANHSWAGMHWARTTTLTLRLGDNVSAVWDPYLVVASVDWTKAVPLDTLIYLGARTPSTCSPTFGKIEVCNYTYGATGWLGIASVWTQNGHIVQGTVKLNDTYFNTPSYNTPSWRRMVTCQEIGHTFGLNHQDEVHNNLNLGSCMDYTNDPSGLRGTNGTKNNEHPNAHDYDQLNSMYAHSDGSQLSTTRAASRAFAGNLVEGADRAAGRPGISDAAPLNAREWGRAVAVDGRGRGRIFIRPLDGGVELTTFVTWADGTDH